MSLPTTHAHTRSVACGVVMIIVSHDVARATGNPHLNADGLQRRFAIAAGRRRLEGGSKGYSCSSQLQWLCWAGVSRGEDPDVTLSRGPEILREDVANSEQNESRRLLPAQLPGYKQDLNGCAVNFILIQKRTCRIYRIL